MRAIYWFRQDLRLQDQPVLQTLAQEASCLLPVYCLNPDHFRSLGLGFAKTGPWRVRFLLESLQDLAASLRARGSDLQVCWGRPETVLPALARQMGADAVYASSEALPEECQESLAVTDALSQAGLSFKLHERIQLLPQENLPFALTDLPTSFTPFRHRVEAQWSVPAVMPASGRLPPLPADIPPQPAWGWPDFGRFGLAAPSDDPRAVLRFQGGESAGLARLEDYIHGRALIRSYRETRNGLLGEAYSSKLSPWLANGALSPRQIYAAVREHENQQGANESTYWLIFELLWREYFRLVATRWGARIFRLKGLRDEARPCRHNQADFETWCQGQTGQSFIDANLRELARSGWMSNRGRQNVASYLIHDLKLPWTWGAAWFEHQLIDYDASSNWGNWMYLAGVGNDPRPYRRFDPVGQASRYDPQGAFQSHWLSEP